MKPLRISSTFNLYARTTEDVSDHIKNGLDFYKAMGFDAADFNMGMLNLATDGWQQHVENTIAASNEIGVHFEICHLPFLKGGGLKDPAYMELFDKRMYNSIDAARLLGVDFAVVHPCASTLPLKSFNRREQYDLVMNHLAPYVEYAMKSGVHIVVENMRVINGARLSHRYCQDPDELCEIADALGVGVCWDFGHANISGLKQSESLEYVGKRLKVLHVNDNSGIDDDHIAPFMGTVDWKDAMHGLALIGFEGLFNYEISTGRLPQSIRPVFARYLLETAHELLSYIE